MPRKPDAIARTIAVPADGAHGLDFDPATRRLFCACDAGVLVTLDAATGKVLNQGKLSGVPDVVWFNPKRRHLYVAVGDPGVVDVFDTTTMHKHRHCRDREGRSYHGLTAVRRLAHRLPARHASRRALWGELT